MSKHMDAQRKALGKGLSALLPHKLAPAPTPPMEYVAAAAAPSLAEREKSLSRSVRVDQIRPNAHQPRHTFDEARIEELAQSIRANGIIQPITVCETNSGQFMIIAGERRWRAAKRAGLEEVPVFVREADQDRILELALIENIQREDLNPIETAQAFDQLITRHQLTHEQIAERTGKDRSTITNFVRLLRLPADVRQALADGKIAMGHARALLAIEDPARQSEACRIVVARNLSVRETEQLAKKPPEAPAAGKPNPERKIDANTKAALEEMAMTLGTKVKIVPRSEKSGRLEIEYYSTDDLQRIYEVIVTSPR